MAMPGGRTLLAVTGLTLLYVLAGKIGLAVALVGPHTSAVSPASGIAVAMLLFVGMRAWPMVAAGAFLVHFTSTEPFGVPLAFATGETLEAVVAATLTARIARGRFAFERGPDVLRFALRAGLLATLIGATAGTAALQAADLISPEAIRQTWLTAWLGDAAAIMVVTPMFVLGTLPFTGGRARLDEAIMLATAVAVVVATVFGVAAPSIRDLPLAFFMVPILLWSAFRFGTRTTAIVAVAAWVIAVYRTMFQLGPFALGEPSIALLLAQTLVALISVLMLSVAAEVDVRSRIERDIRRLNETLEQRVDERTEELSRVSGRLLAAQAVAHIGGWEWDITRGTLWWSDEMLRIVGIRDAPKTIEQMFAWVHPEDRAPTEAIIRQAAVQGGPFTCEHRIVASDGQVRVMHVRGRVESAGLDRPGRMIGISQDVTESKRAEQARAQLIHEQAARREAEEANRAKDAFLATLSHELRTPLNAALGWTQILRDSPRITGREKQIVQTVYRNLLIQSRLVSDILDVARIVKGGLPVDREAVSLLDVVEAALDMVRETASQRRVTVDVHVDGTPTVEGDARRLQQVAWNLLSNGVKFAAEGGRVTVVIAEDESCATLSVEDDGPGVPPEFLPFVFEQFRQADSSVTRSHGGLGLGLAIAHHIVELHHGRISARNRPDGGAVFTVRLPHRQETEAPEVNSIEGVSRSM